MASQRQIERDTLKVLAECVGYFSVFQISYLSISLTLHTEKWDNFSEVKNTSQALWESPYQSSLRIPKWLKEEIILFKIELKKKTILLNFYFPIPAKMKCSFWSFSTVSLRQRIILTHLLFQKMLFIDVSVSLTHWGDCRVERELCYFLFCF